MLGAGLASAVFLGIGQLGPSSCWGGGACFLGIGQLGPSVAATGNSSSLCMGQPGGGVVDLVDIAIK